jgi:hypothetical protein
MKNHRVMEAFAREIHVENEIGQWNENQHLMALFNWVREEIKRGRRSLRLLSAIPNGRGFVTKKCVEQYDEYGFCRGLPDIIYLWPSRKYHGLVIELKSLQPGARLSPAQAEMIRKLNKVGYRAEVCYGFLNAIQVINGYDDGVR